MLNSRPDLAAQQVGANETYAAVCEWNLNNAESLSCNLLYGKLLEVSQNKFREITGTRTCYYGLNMFMT